MSAPIRTVKFWHELDNPDADRRARFPRVWIGTLSPCNHAVNIGAGPAPTIMQMRCVECASEPEAA